MSEDTLPNVVATCRHIAKRGKPAATSFTLERGDGRAWTAAGVCLGIVTEIKVCKQCQHKRRHEGSSLYVGAVRVTSAGPPPRYCAKTMAAATAIGDWATETECAAAIFALHPGFTCEQYKAVDNGERRLFCWKAGRRYSGPPDFEIIGPRFTVEIWKAAKA